MANLRRTLFSSVSASLGKVPARCNPGSKKKEDLKGSREKLVASNGTELEHQGILCEAHFDTTGEPLSGESVTEDTPLSSPCNLYQVPPDRNTRQPRPRTGHLKDSHTTPQACYHSFCLRGETNQAEHDNPYHFNRTRNHGMDLAAGSPLWTFVAAQFHAGDEATEPEIHGGVDIFGLLDH